MRQPQNPENESERLEALLELELLDKPADAKLQGYAELAAQICGVSTGAISLIDTERQWFTAIFGDAPHDTRRSVSPTQPSSAVSAARSASDIGPIESCTSSAPGPTALAP